MAKRQSARRAGRRPAAVVAEQPRRSKGRARTRASGVKILEDTQGDEKRLREQLSQMGLYAVNTLGDGNCLFRALADQLYGSPDGHTRTRADVCAYLAQHEARYRAFVDTDEEESWETHLTQMARQGTYGGHLELSAFANLHSRPIKIIQPGMVYVISHDESLGTSSKRPKGKGKRTSDDGEDNPATATTPLYLVYHQWEHYSSVRNLDGPHAGLPQIRERRQPCQVDNCEQNSSSTGQRSSQSSKGSLDDNDDECAGGSSSSANSPRVRTDQLALATTTGDEQASEPTRSPLANYRDCSPTSAGSGATTSSSAPSSATPEQQPSPPQNLRTRPQLATTVTQNGSRISKKEARQARRRQARHQALTGSQYTQRPGQCYHHDGTETASLFKELKV